MRGLAMREQEALSEGFRQTTEEFMGAQGVCQGRCAGLLGSAGRQWSKRGYEAQRLQLLSTLYW
jgi:hypothetical protein